jgi:hypothetical protein
MLHLHLKQAQLPFISFFSLELVKKRNLMRWYWMGLLVNGRLVSSPVGFLFIFF